MLVEARAAQQRGDPSTPARYRAVLDRYPDDVDAWYLLGDWLFHNGADPRRLADARPVLERAVALVPAHLHSLVHLARIAAVEGCGVDVDTLTRRARAATCGCRDRRDARPPRRRSLAHFEAGAGRAHAAAAQLDSDDALVPGSATLARMQLAAARTALDPPSLAVAAARPPRAGSGGHPRARCQGAPSSRRPRSESAGVIQP